ncbi:DoxX family protein [Nocardia sp. NPDC058176]|uniref:DoxX family protein n=1 Tax=Nocardia sp. NPDC058176 TaxID=3346368 RepID=UPI0036D7DCDA
MATAAHDLLLLLVRIVVGAAFVAGARTAFTDTRKFATRNSLPLPLAYFVGTAELLGGIGVLLGLLSPLPAAGLMLLMLGTMSIHIFRWRSPYWASEGGWEYDLMLFTLSGVIVCFGPGDLSLDALIAQLRH